MFLVNWKIKLTNGAVYQSKNSFIYPICFVKFSHAVWSSGTVCQSHSFYLFFSFVRLSVHFHFVAITSITFEKIHFKQNEKHEQAKSMYFRFLCSFFFVFCPSYLFFDFILSYCSDALYSIWFLISFIICWCQCLILELSCCRWFFSFEKTLLQPKLSNIRAHFERKLPDSN